MFAMLPSSVELCTGPSPRSLLLSASSSSSGRSSSVRRRCSCSSTLQWQQPMHHSSTQHTAAGAVPRRHQHQLQLVALRRPRPAAVSAASPAAAAAAAAPSAAAAASTAAADGWRALLLDKALGAPGQLVKLQLKGRIQGDPQLAVVRPAAGSTSSSIAAAAAAACDGVPAAAQPNSMPYRQLTLRPVLLRGKMMLQLSVFTERQDITKNHTPQQAQQELARLLQLPWSSAALLTLQESVTVTISRKGKAQVTCKQAPASSSSGGGTASAAASASDTPPPQPAAVDLPDGFLAPPGSSSSSSSAPMQQQQQQQQLISLQHDRPKAQPIDGSTPHPFLQQIGLQTADGRIKASMQGKFTQINEFLRLLAHSGALDKFKGRAQKKPGAAAAASLDSQDSRPEDSSSSSSERPVHVLDAGCGSSHLTLGTFHYLSSVLSLPVRLSGVDTNAALMARSNRTCAELGIERVAQFHAATIRDVPALGLPPPDLLLALHACDTATDEALALGVGGGARLIMCVPCCHKDLHQQFAQQQRQQQQQQQQQQGSRSSGRGRGGSGGQAAVTGLFAPLLGHGILKQRQLDLLTDSLRASLLRLAGYRTDVVEFVSTEHTPRNLLIRAVRATQPLTASDTARLGREYVQLRDAWGVAPRLEALLREDGSLSEAVLRELGG